MKLTSPASHPNAPSPSTLHKTRQLISLTGLCLCANWLGLATAGAQTTARIVDWGHDWGVGWFREGVNGPGGTRSTFPAFDLDGDGDTSDDSTAGWDFDLNKPLSPENSRYDSTLPNAVFYGGAVVQVSNIAGDRARAPSEGHINQNHELRDDWNLMAMPSVKKQPELESYRAAGIWLWAKEDFLNGGERDRVSFSGDDYIAIFISRYFGGVDWGRWILRDGETFYISEATFAGVESQFTYQANEKTDGARNPVVRRSHVIHPAQSKWAEFDPKPNADFFFDPGAATYTERSFEDVAAIGFMVQRELSQGAPAAKALSLKEPIGVKFNAVQAVATIDRDANSSPYLALDKLSSGSRVSAQAVSFDLWAHVVKWAVTNQRASNFPDEMKSAEIGGYTFLQDGQPGSIALSGATSASTADPVTMITALDAMAWCNALSELEGLEPAYYSDAAHTQVLRTLTDRSKTESYPLRPQVFWKTSATGYRLPTTAELTETDAAEQAEPEFIYAWPGDNATYDPGTEAAAAYGGDAPTNTSLFAGGTPFREGDPRIGVRVARGAGTPSSPGAGTWNIATDAQLPSTIPMTEEALRDYVRNQLNLVTVDQVGYLPSNDNYRKDYNKAAGGPYKLAISSGEIAYAVWNIVERWARMEAGYQFNHDGTPGSIRFRKFGSEPRQISPEEPVVNISWMDAIVWCNALSELMELEPVYLDPTSGQPIRVSNPFRLETYAPYHYPNEGRYPNRELDTAAIIEVSTDTARSGFRLPSQGEMERIAPKSSAHPHPALAHTQPVRSGVAHDEIFGLYGNAAEWTYGGDRLFGQWIFGSDFSYPDGKTPHRINSKDHAFANRSYLSFRPVRRAE